MPCSATSQPIMGSTAIGIVGHQQIGMQAEALPRLHDHVLDDPGFGLADWRGCVPIDDDGIVDIDEMVRGIGKDGSVAVGTGVEGGRMTW